MVHISKLISPNSETVFFLFKNLANALAAQPKRLITFLMPESIIDHLQIIQIKQYNSRFLQLRCLLFQLLDSPFISISVHDIRQHICISNFLQIQKSLFLNILVIIARHLQPAQGNDKSQRSKGKKYGCRLKLSYIIQNHFCNTKTQYNIQRIPELFRLYIILHFCFVMNQRERINNVASYQHMGYRKNLENVYNSNALQKHSHCHIQQIKHWKAQRCLAVFALTDIIYKKIKRYRKQEKSKEIYKI